MLAALTRRGAGAALLLTLAPAPATAQAVVSTAAANAPDGAGNAPPEKGGKVVDTVGLASRGGAPVASKTYGETIGTAIFSPIGSAVGTSQRPGPHG